ncbi:hypothetical protein IV203_020917 [Nitzschia inconspicua]|uniref:Uncharacterized protein n=1 Tax=Nitzschia inconspicua TaxID=303405 RepID=A0A9K3PCT5_9STRA|nr:hypothetical protein IV203_020917 [Nitzschia inconspicua]
MISILFFIAISFASVLSGSAYELTALKRPAACLLTKPSISRQNFLAVTAGVLSVGLASDMAWAKDADAIKGTKDDPAFQTCLSQCMYECTKPKGSEQKSRKECLPDCKKQCAKTDAQLLKGTPKA